MNAAPPPYFVTGGTGPTGVRVTYGLAQAGHAVTVFDLAPDIALVDRLRTSIEKERS